MKRRTEGTKMNIKQFSKRPASNLSLLSCANQHDIDSIKKSLSKRNTMGPSSTPSIMDKSKSSSGGHRGCSSQQSDEIQLQYASSSLLIQSNETTTAAPKKTRKGGMTKGSTYNNHPLVVRPKRPRSAYNLFFQEQRQRMLKEAGEELSDDEKEDSSNRFKVVMKAPPTTDNSDPSSSPPKDEQAEKHSTKRKRGRPRGPNYRPRKVCKKRGAFSFSQLAKKVGAQWKNLDETCKSGYQEQASIDLRNYREAMKVYNTTVAKLERENNDSNTDKVDISDDSNNIHNNQNNCGPSSEESSGHCVEKILSKRKISKPTNGLISAERKLPLVVTNASIDDRSKSPLEEKKKRNPPTSNDGMASPTLSSVSPGSSCVSFDNGWVGVNALKQAAAVALSRELSSSCHRYPENTPTGCLVEELNKSAHPRKNHRSIPRSNDQGRVTASSSISNISDSNSSQPVDGRSTNQCRSHAQASALFIANTNAVHKGYGNESTLRAARSNSHSLGPCKKRAVVILEDTNSSSACSLDDTNYSLEKSSSASSRASTPSTEQHNCSRGEIPCIRASRALHTTATKSTTEATRFSLKHYVSVTSSGSDSGSSENSQKDCSSDRGSSDKSSDDGRTSPSEDPFDNDMISCANEEVALPTATK